MFIEHSLCATYCSHARFLITQCTASHNEMARLAEFQMRDTVNPTSTTSNSIRIQEFILLVTLCLHSLSSIGQIHLFLLKTKPKNSLVYSFVHPHIKYLLLENSAHDFQKPTTLAACGCCLVHCRFSINT